MTAHAPSNTVSPIDSASNVIVGEVIGNKSDTVNGTSLISLNKRQLEAQERDVGVLISKTIRVTGGPGAIIANVLQFAGSIKITDQYARIASVTTLTNATAVYADLYDGTNSVNLTINGVVLSGFEEGSLLSKAEDITNPYVTMRANQVRVFEATSKEAGKEFLINAKTGADNFIRFHITTTDAPVDFTMDVVFEYVPLFSDSTLVFL